jgi:hypothetical protein
MSKKKKMIIKDVPVTLLPVERERKGIELAERLQVKFDAEAHQNSVKAAWKKDLHELDVDIARLRRIVQSGTETRAVECQESPNWSTKLVEIFRIDTGELIDFRPMTEAELQREIDFGSGEMQ